MKKATLLLFLLPAWVAAGIGLQTPRPAADRPPVIIELFTSEGCSSCPPADSLLIELDEMGLEGIDVLPLSQHVDYWDRLGWKDPFSSAAFTARQQDYAARLGLATIYTPQVVVDGVEEMVGSDRTKISAAIRKAAERPKLPLALELRRAGDGVEIVARLAPLTDVPRHADWVIAMVESGLSTQVPRGENRGRTLPHTGVVRTWKHFGASEIGKTKKLEVLPDWEPDHLRVISFIQDRKSGRVLAAASASLPD